MPAHHSSHALAPINRRYATIIVSLFFLLLWHPSPARAQFCTTLRQVVDAARSEFSSIRGTREDTQDGSDFYGSHLKLEGFNRCSVEKDDSGDFSYYCLQFGGSQDKYDSLVNQVKGCGFRTRDDPAVTTKTFRTGNVVDRTTFEVVTSKSDIVKVVVRHEHGKREVVGIDVQLLQ